MDVHKQTTERRPNMLFLVALLVLASVLGPAGLALGLKTHNFGLAWLLLGGGFTISFTMGIGIIDYYMDHLLQPGPRGGKAYMDTATAGQLEYLIELTRIVVIGSVIECALAGALYIAGVL